MVAVSSVMTTEALLEATAEASRTGEAVAAAVLEEAATEEVRPLPSPASRFTARLWEPLMGVTTPQPRGLPTAWSPASLPHVICTGQCSLFIVVISLSDHPLLEESWAPSVDLTRATI